jgi:hypothetical protein
MKVLAVAQANMAACRGAVYLEWGRRRECQEVGSTARYQYSPPGDEHGADETVLGSRRIVDLNLHGATSARDVTQDHAW